MDAFNSLIDGFGTALTPLNLLWAAVGVLLGTAIGVLPGIGPAMAVALLLPVTYGLDPTGAFIMFAGIYYGAMFGGSTTSILLNTPGESAAVVAAMEGNPMAKAGRGSQALAAAAIGHFAGGMIGTLLLVALAPTVASLAVDIGAPDYLAIMVLAFIAVTSVLGSSRVRGLASLLIGLTIGLVGLDQMTGQQRLTFGSLQLADGVDVVIVAVGLFAIGDALWVAAHLRRTSAEAIPVGRPGSAARTSSAPGSRGCAGRSSVSRSARSRPAARRSRPSCRTWARSGSPSTRRSGARAPSRAWRAPSRPPPPRPPAPSSRC
ncbi:hypothetical protein CCOS2040_00960 [Streptomyces albidoflavus]|nr:hypothetical protein CCOS2040_00960 [Streptomyces albidoflavus]